MRLPISLSLLLLGLFSCHSPKPLATVPNLDLERYSGRWYEIERLPNSFEKGLSCVQARYSLKADGTIGVENSGYGKDGWEKVSGKALRKDPAKPGEIKVTFFWPFYGDYYVIDLDPDYHYALVGSPSRKYLWILAREPQLPEEQIQALKQKAEALGFDTAAMEGLEYKHLQPRKTIDY